MTDLTQSLQELRLFLNGEGPLDGQHFGDTPPRRRTFWWRRHLGRIDQAVDKIEGLEADLFLAVQTAYDRGAVEWTRLNYPTYYERLRSTPPRLETVF